MIWAGRGPKQDINLLTLTIVNINDYSGVHMTVQILSSTATWLRSKVMNMYVCRHIIIDEIKCIHKTNKNQNFTGK